MTRLDADFRPRYLLLVTLFAFASLALYSVSRTAGLIALGVATSAYLVPLTSGVAARRLLLFWACAAPVLVALLISLQVRDLQGDSPTMGFALLWVANALTFPTLLALASGGTGAVRRVFRRGVPLTLLGILGLALLVRVIALESLPAPFSGDEALFTLIARERGAGAPLNLFGSGYFGSANLYFQLGAWVQLLPFAVDVSARLLSVILGVLAVLFVFLFARTARDTRTAVCAAVALALLPGHIHFSRTALPNIDETAVSAAVLFSALWALRRGTVASYGVAGMVCGLAPYAWTTGRIIAVVPVLLFTVAAVRGPRRTALQGVAVYVVGALIVAAPLLSWWAEHPGEFRTRDAFALVYGDPPGPELSWWSTERANGRSSSDILSAQFQSTLDAVFVGPERTVHFNSEVGVFGALPSLLFLVGLLVATRQVGRPENAAVLGLLCASFVGGGLLSIPPASAARLTGVLVPGAYLIALGATALAGLNPRLSADSRGQLPLAIVVLCALPGVAYYFGEWRHENRYSDDRTRLAAEWASVVREEFPADSSVLWFAQPPIDASHMALRVHLFGRTTVVVDEQGRARETSSWGATESETLTVVVTGTRSVPKLPGADCDGMVPAAVHEGSQPKANLVIYAPGQHCAAELRRLYFPVP